MASPNLKSIWPSKEAVPGSKEKLTTHLKKLVVALVREQRIQQDISELSDLNDRQLLDIGLDRSEISKLVRRSYADENGAPTIRSKIITTVDPA